VLKLNLVCPAAFGADIGEDDHGNPYCPLCYALFILEHGQAPDIEPVEYHRLEHCPILIELGNF
jgi:hypothetical protein